MLCLCFIFILLGCANTVTLKESIGSEITFKVTFGESPSFLNYRYFIVYADSSFKLNTNLTNHYFFIPGENYNESDVSTLSNGEGLSYFYSQYFSTWGGILELKPSDVSITQGPFSSSLQTDSDHYNYTSNLLSINNYSVEDTHIVFAISADNLTIKDNVFYFSLITIKGNEASNIEDLISDLQIVDVIANSPPKTGSNETSLFSPDAPAKIESWTVSVQ